MSTSSNQNTTYNRRVESLRQNSGHIREESQSSRRRNVSSDDAYTYALRVAYLAYLLQPRQKRKQHTSTPSHSTNRINSSSIPDLMKDFTLLRDSKSTKFPHGFMDELEKRLTGVMMGKERRQEYQDAAVKRCFAAYLNVFIEPSFKKRMEKDRRVEDLVLIFYSNATRVLQAGKKPDDESWKLMVDRYLALFVRLLSLIMKETDSWSRDRPELASRLATLESKLLAHDEDLAADGSTNGTITEVIVQLTYDVKDMPLVQVVGRIFMKQPAQLQADIDVNKTLWTEEVALDDLKKYQKLLSLNSTQLLSSDDFELEEAYEVWKKAEVQAISQMMLAILSAKPQLAKQAKPTHAPSASVASLSNKPIFGHGHTPSVASLSSGNTIRPVRSDSYTMENKNGHLEDYSMYIVDQPFDMSGVSPITSRTGSWSECEEQSFVFRPSDPRGVYKAILVQALAADLNYQEPSADDPMSITLLSHATTELLNEICLRWRMPYFSRIVLFLDVCRDKFLDGALDVESLVAAFDYAKELIPDTKKDDLVTNAQLHDRSKWTFADMTLNQQILRSLNDALLRDLHDTATQCYEPKPPSVGMIIYVLENFIFNDEGFPKEASDLEDFSESLREGLRENVRAVYKEYIAKHIPSDPMDWHFYVVIDLGRDLMNLSQRIQKRYRKNPKIMGADPLIELLQSILPTFASDARDIVKQVLKIAKVQGEEIPVDDGFDLYKELVEIRNIHFDALPDVPFAFDIEDLLAVFVWRWIELTEKSIKTWVEGAFKQDMFEARLISASGIAEDDQRHSNSVLDIFTSFNETINRIVHLDWDNDLHYAKFMTALARVVGIGLAHYCELVEQRFTKEMDRMTPEQEAATSQTRQERWMQLAKDAWNSKDKIEPFQFFPEVSF